MVDVLRRGKRGGTVTTSYPAGPESAPAAFRGQVLLHVDRCIGDGACARVCPSTAIAVTMEPGGSLTWELDDARCVFCGLCADACPTAAISLSTEFELSARVRSQLVTRATFGAHPQKELE